MRPDPARAHVPFRSAGPGCPDPPNEAADRLTAERLLPGLRTRWLGRTLHWLEETDSTNRVAQELARAGAAEGTAVVAEGQTAGRGRLGRTWASPEGGACLASLRKLLGSGFLQAHERILLYNTGSGLKYLEAFSTRFPQSNLSEHDKLGGLITPR